MAGGTGAARALIVEDNPDEALLLQAVLSREGFVTEVAAGGYRALEAARCSRPDLITLDLGLPDIDGLEVCRALRVFTEAYILIVSGSAEEATRLDGLGLGADGFLTKPVNPRELGARVQAMMRRPRAETVPSSELEMAARVQQQLLPEQTPILAGYDVAGACRPTRAVGGDFFDWDCDGGLMSITLADAMGKGMGAALVAATARAVLRTGKPDRGAEAVVRQAAAVLEADLVRISSFLTLLLLQVDGRTGQAEYVDAGHGLGLVVHPDGSWERLLNGGPPLGLVPGATWNAGNFKLEPGSSAVVVSDGVLDSFAGLEDALQAVSETVRRAEEAKEAVNDVLAMAAAAEDDVTAVVLRRTA